ncbi:MAG: hypothetical protein AVDCRST_MAG65-57, partial [uncultured Solirubrobacteraceae bacterium]
ARRARRGSPRPRDHGRRAGDALLERGSGVRALRRRLLRRSGGRAASVAAGRQHARHVGRLDVRGGRRLRLGGGLRRRRLRRGRRLRRRWRLRRRKLRGWRLRRRRRWRGLRRRRRLL